MGTIGKPDAELEDLLAWIETIQQHARAPIRAGMIGREIFDTVESVLSASPLAANTHFVGRGIGTIGHEALRLSNRGPVAYPAYDADLPLQVGMVLSIETTLAHPPARLHQAGRHAGDHGDGF
jgi:Xaa-Pro aminopeptidase